MSCPDAVPSQKNGETIRIAVNSEIPNAASHIRRTASPFVGLGATCGDVILLFRVHTIVTMPEMYLQIFAARVRLPHSRGIIHARMSTANTNDAAEPLPEPIIEARQLEKHYPQPDGSRIQVIAPLNLAVYPGQIIALLGASGCGKSTLMRMLTG